LRIAKENKQIRDWEKKRRREDQEFSRKKVVELFLVPKEEGRCHSTMKATVES
jgi:hypothetical protein